MTSCSLHIHGGNGVAAFLYRNGKLLKNINNTDLESLWITILIPNMRKMVIGTVYRPPQGNIQNFMKLFEQQIKDIHDKHNQPFDLFILGDFNIDYSNNRALGRSDIRDLEELYGLKQLITEPTRYGNKPSIIDYILTNSDCIREHGVTHPNISDHELIFVTRKKLKIKHSTINTFGRSYKNYNKNVFQEMLVEHDWSNLDRIVNPNDYWKTLLDGITFEIDKLCPLKTMVLKDYGDPWVTREIVEVLKDKKRLFLKAKRTKLPEDLQAARKARNSANKMVKQAKEDFIKENLEDNNNNAKKFWEHINKLLPKKTANNTINIIDENNLPITKENVANYINTYFVGIGEELARKFDSNNTPIYDQLDSVMNNIETTQVEVLELCKDININKSSAIEYVSSKILKDAFIILSKKLTTCFNLSFATGIFPDEWKLAKITPLHKGGQKNQINNYRPISLLPLPGKLIEKIVHKRITLYLDEHEILNTNQNGFRSKHSTQDTVAKFTDDIAMNINNNKCTLATFIDFRKAFDTVNHKILLTKIHSLGISNNVGNWLTSYLHNRKQVVFANGITSREGSITCGVPQGSTLGPLLFLIYINDINKNFVNSRIKLFADDTVLYTSSTIVDLAKHNIQIDLNTLDSWCKQHKLSINIGKTKNVLFGSKKFTKNITYPKLAIGGKEINFVDEYKYLGIVLDKNLTYTKHIKYIHSLAAHKIYLLSKIRTSINTPTAMRIYKTKILPYFDQGDILYNDAFIKDVSKLQKLQNRAIRICLNENNRQHVNNLQHMIGLPKLCDRRIYRLSVYAYSRSKTEEYLDNKQVRTRQREAPILKSFKSDFRVVDRCVYLQSANLWNTMDVATRNIDNIDSFKIKQKKWLDNQIPPLVC